MELIVFAGPSVRTPDAAAARHIEFRPPARCGDITRAVRETPTMIGLIDGVFETAASVWHKEILHALEHGIGVLGAASMGALRAVELEQFGMIGIGEIFRAYRDGWIEDDDEVAVVHGPAELGYLPLTEAMVNIRATLKAAQQADILRQCEADVFCIVAKGLFYKQRTWPRILADTAARGVAGCVAERFGRWRMTCGIDVKRRDAQLLIDAMLNPCPALRSCATSFVASRTKYWLGHTDIVNLPP